MVSTGPVFPAVDFPLYGAVDPTLQVRWLEFLDGSPSGTSGPVLRSVWLGHAQRPKAGTPAIRWLYVGSLPRGAPTADADTLSAEAREVVIAPVFDLLSRAAPDGEESRRRAYFRALWPELERRVDAYQEWETVSWTLDGGPVPASVTRFAGAWAGVSFAEPRVAEFGAAEPCSDLVAVGYGLEPDQVMVRELPDAAGYGFDASRPLPYPRVIEASRAAALRA